jgi:hypothetical protein
MVQAKHYIVWASGRRAREFVARKISTTPEKNFGGGARLKFFPSLPA